ncbi:hypothetical protein AB0B89_01385 [Sphaerisporangium sp. NPDC049002]
MIPGFVFRADPLKSRCVDGHFARQARTLRDLGGAVALVDHDARKERAL